jgi:phosphatidylglycerophosphate synthase
VSRASVRARLPLRILIAALGTGLFAYLVWRAGPSKLLADVVALRWGVVLIIVLAGCSHLAKTWAWALMLGDGKQRVPFSRLFALRLGAEAIGQLGIVGQTFGDSIRISYLRSEVPAARGVSSVSLDRGLFLVTGTVVVIVGITTAALVLPLPHALGRFAGIFVVVLCGFLLSTALVVHRRWPVLSGTTVSLGRLSFFRNWVDKNWRLIHSVENMLFDFYHQTPRAFWASFALNLACHVMAVGEVCLIVYFLGARIGFLSALAIEALTKLVNALGNLNPGNIGTYEAGNVLIGKMFGLSTAAGLALGLSRRVRALFWAAVGGVVLFLVTRSSQRRKSQPVSGVANGSRGSAPLPESPDVAKTAEGSLLAVILSPALCSDKQTGGTSPRVGSLPVLLRAILTAQKTGAARIIVVVGSGHGLDTLQDLQKTGRLPASVEWLEAVPGMPLSDLLAKPHTPPHSDRVLLIEGNRTYHPMLVKQAAEWQSEERGLTLLTGDDVVGIYLFPSQLVRRLSDYRVESLADLRASLPTTELVQAMPVGGSLWQRVETPEDCRSAERKLDRWLVKPTDGFYAQLNRRISIPISRQLIKWPITPNMVSLFTLAVGLASSLLFATGGYWYMLAGALLSLLASILDGCDGEVARLKLMESDFGCWLETACDYLYYLFLFIGLMLGLEKTSGSKAYLTGGAVLLFGAVASFLTVALQRHVLASERPEQLLQIWQEHVDSRRSNLLLFVSRHTEFIVRRCFFPYALLLFALFNVMSVAFWLSVLGANLVWPIALYSCLAFRRGSGSAAVTALSAVRSRPRLMTREFLETP